MDLDIMGHGRDQEILVLIQAELLGADRFQEVVLEEVVCSHADDNNGVSDYVFCSVVADLSG